MSVEVDDPVHGAVRQAGIAFRLHGAPEPTVQGPQPAVGEHTDEVLGSLDGDGAPCAARCARRSGR